WAPAGRPGGRRPPRPQRAAPASAPPSTTQSAPRTPRPSAGLGRSFGLRDHVRAGPRALVAALDQKPLRRLRARALEREAAAEALPVQHEHGVATLDRLGPRHAPALLVGAGVPELELARFRLARLRFERHALVGGI